MRSALNVSTPERLIDPQLDLSFLILMAEGLSPSLKQLFCRHAMSLT